MEFCAVRNPDLTETPMTVRFETRREDFPPNPTNLRIQNVTLYFARRIGELFEQDVRHLLFHTEGSEGGLGGPASSVDGDLFSCKAGARP